MYKSREVQKTIWKPQQGDWGNVLVQRGAENHIQLLERDTDVKQPFRQGWTSSRIFPRGNFRPKQIRFTGEEKVLQRLPTNSTVQDFFKLYITEEMMDHLIVQKSICKTVFGQRKRHQTTFKSA